MKDKDPHQSTGRVMLNKVPEITLFFWVIKILCTTVGETGADLLNTTFNLGLNGITLIIGTLLAVTLIFQFKSKKYVPGIYWLAVVLISIVVILKGNPSLSVILSVMRVPTILIRTTASQ